MSETKTLKEKLQAAQEVTSLASADNLAVIDTAGDVKKIKPFGTINKKIYFTEAAGGLSVKILIADLGPYPVETGFGLFGFCGLCFKQNEGYISNGLGMAVVNAACSYSVTESGVKLDTTQAHIRPSVVKYNGHVYIAISVRGNSGTVHLIGYGYNLLDSPIVIGSKNGTPSDTSEVLYSGIIIGGGVRHYRSITYAISQKGGLRDEYDDRTYQRLPEGEDDRRNGVSRSCGGSGYMCETRHLRCDRSIDNSIYSTIHRVADGNSRSLGTQWRDIPADYIQVCKPFRNTESSKWCLDELVPLHTYRSNLIYGKEVAAA